MKIVAYAAIISLAGCMAGNMPTTPSGAIPPGSTPLSALSSAAGVTHILYVADDNTNAVYRFNADNLTAQPIGKISMGIDFPQGLAVAPNGDLYVANHSAQDVTAYKPGINTPFRTIKTTGKYPAYIAISADGTMAIAYYGRSGANGMLVVYDKGSATPTRNITIPIGKNIFLILLGLEIDSSDNLYLSFSGYASGPTVMLKYPPGSTAGTNTKIYPGSNGGFDSRGDMFVGSEFDIAMYAPGATTFTRRITKGILSVGLFAVAPDGTLFVPNTSHYVEGIPTAGNLVKYAPGSFTPALTISSPYLQDAVAAAVTLRRFPARCSKEKPASHAGFFLMKRFP